MAQPITPQASKENTTQAPISNPAPISPVQPAQAPPSIPSENIPNHHITSIVKIAVLVFLVIDALLIIYIGITFAKRSKIEAQSTSPISTTNSPTSP